MIDLKKIPAPCIVLADNLAGSWFSRKIKEHTKGEYSHAMWMTSDRMFVSQDWRLHKVDPAVYLDGKHRLKFLWRSLLEIPKFAADVEEVLNRQVRENTRYDWLGIVGHLLGYRKLNFEGRYYCSEAVWQPFVEVFKYAQIYPSPEDLNKLLPRMGWQVVGLYDPNKG